MRKIVTIALGLGAFIALASPALAVDKCHIPPPSWWNAPRVTNVYEGGRASYASSRSSDHTFSFSAQRRSQAESRPRFRDPFARW